jgi:uncharacterized small protein (DUF1192 family)
MARAFPPFYALWRKKLDFFFIFNRLIAVLHAGGSVMDTDEIDPPRPVLKPLDLQQMSIGELRDYVASLKIEIARAEEAIGKKVAHRDGLAGLFKN